MLADKKITAFAKKAADLPNKPRDSGITGDQVKAQIDFAPEELRKALNGVIDILISIVAGESGAESVGSAPITGVTGATIYAQLADIKAQLDGVALGALPDGSVTGQKLKLAVNSGINVAGDGSISVNAPSGSSSINSPLTWI